MTSTMWPWYWTVGKLTTNSSLGNYSQSLFHTVKTKQRTNTQKHYIRASLLRRLAIVRSRSKYSYTCHVCATSCYIHTRMYSVLTCIKRLAGFLFSRPSNVAMWMVRCSPGAGYKVKSAILAVMTSSSLYAQEIDMLSWRGNGLFPEIWVVLWSTGPCQESLVHQFHCIPDECDHGV